MTQIDVRKRLRWLLKDRLEISQATAASFYKNTTRIRPFAIPFSIGFRITTCARGVVATLFACTARILARDHLIHAFSKKI
jgi:hypothetical protein